MKIRRPNRFDTKMVTAKIRVGIHGCELSAPTEMVTKNDVGLAS